MEGKGAGDGDKFCALFDQFLIENRKTEIVTDAEAQGAQGGFYYDRVLTWGDSSGFLKARAFGEVDVKQVDFSVEGQDFAIWTKENGGIIAAPGVAGFGDGACQQVDFVLAGQFSQMAMGGTIQGFCQGNFLGRGSEKCGVFWGQDEFCSIICGSGQ